MLALDISRKAGISVKVLVRHDIPEWALSMFEAIGIKRNQLEWFDASRERVLLRHGLIPANLGTTHPHLASLFSSIDGGRNYRRRNIYYLSRRSFPHRRGCQNEARLEGIAVTEFGAKVILPEAMPWIEQVRLFRSARVVVGLAGSALHTSAVSNGELTVASIGAINRMQSAIATLQGQRMAYQVGFSLSNSYSVPEDGFRSMMRSVCEAQDFSLIERLSRLRLFPRLRNSF